MNEEIHLQEVSEELIHEPEYNELPSAQIMLNGIQQRQYRYTIDNLTI